MLEKVIIPPSLEDVRSADQAEKMVDGCLIRYRSWNADTRRFDWTERIGDQYASLCYSPLFSFLFQIDDMSFYRREPVKVASISEVSSCRLFIA